MGDIANYQNAIFPEYNLRLTSEVEFGDTFLSKIRRNKETFKTGTQSRIEGAEMSKSEGNVFAGATGDAATLPPYSDVDIQQMTTTPIIGWMVTQINPAAQPKFGSGKSFLVDLLKYKLRTTQENCLARMSQQCLGGVATGSNAGTHVLALVNGDPGTGTTVTIDSPFSKTALGTSLGTNATHLFGKNMYIDFINPADGTSRTGTPSTGYQVTKVDSTNKQLTIGTAANAAIADNDYIVRYGEYNAGINGLMTLVSNSGNGPTTLLGVSRTTYPDFAATRIHNSGQAWALSDALLNQLFTNVSIKTGKEPKSGYTIFTRPELIDQFSQAAAGLRRLGPTETKLGGEDPVFRYRGMDFKFWSDIHAAPNRIWLLNMSDIGCLELAPLQWDRSSGNYLTTIASAQTSALAMRAVGYTWFNLYLRAPFKHGVLEDLAM